MFEGIQPGFDPSFIRIDAKRESGGKKGEEMGLINDLWSPEDAAKKKDTFAWGEISQSERMCLLGE